MKKPNPSDEIPDTILTEIVRLTKRVALEDDDTLRKERAELADQFGFRIRVRQDGEGITIILYPSEWIENETVVLDRIDDIDRAVEIPMYSEQYDLEWDQIDEFNRHVVKRIEDKYGKIHGENAAIFADFVGNHLAMRISEVTQTDIDEFRSEYFIRNAWPSDRQVEEIERSLEFIQLEADQMRGGSSHITDTG